MNGAITKDIMIKYESIKRSGKFDIWIDSEDVMTILWPDKDHTTRLQLYSYLLQNYPDLMEMYFLDENYPFPKFE